MISLAQALKSEHAWTGSMEELAEKATALCAVHAIRPHVHLPGTSKSLIISYRSRNILSPPRGKRFIWEHLVQLLAARTLISAGWRREKVADHIHRYPLDYLVMHLAELDVALNESQPSSAKLQSPEPNKDAILAARMLATGVCSQYRLARSGTPTVHDITLSAPLAQALFLLSSLYVSAGQEDLGGSVHEVLQRCRQPLGSGDWNLAAFMDPAFPYHRITLR